MQISCKSSLIYADFMLIIDMICKCIQSFTRCSLKGYTNVIYSYFNYTEICLILHVHIRQKIEKYGGDFMLISFFFKLMNIHNMKIILFTLNIP